MFTITSEPIDGTALQRELDDARAGGCVVFEGRVRERNEGRAVLGLDYEACVPLAEKEGVRILEEARAKFALIGARAAHRIGTLGLGELAIWVGATAEHRGEAFAACRYIVDEAKARLPIWKREHYADGTRDWINSA